jgi:integrase/recombinase XerD
VVALIAAAGLRISEATNLNRADVDPKHGVLTIVRSKFKKSRLVPLHITTTRALVHYAKRRDAVLPVCHEPAFLVSHLGKRLDGCGLRNGFVVAPRRVGQRPIASDQAKRGRGPRVHDLRHRFAARTLLDWYRDGKNAEREMPKRVTYLGHTRVTETHWYIEALPELLGLASHLVTSANLPAAGMSAVFSGARAGLLYGAPAPAAPGEHGRSPPV